MKTLLGLLIVLLAMDFGMGQGNFAPGNTIKVAGLQMNVTNDISKNKDRILSGVREAAAGKAIFLVTPEGSLSGYRSQFNQQEVLTALKDILAARRLDEPLVFSP